MRIMAKAPLRISFAGGGTDVPPFPEREGGCVLSATISKYAWGSLVPRTDEFVTIESLDLSTTIMWVSNKIPAPDGQEGLDLVVAAVRQFAKPHGFDLLLHSDAPPRSGLGSSSALAVALVGLMNQRDNKHMGQYEIADKAHEIERVELGIPGGMQDHYAAAFGGFNFIEFQADRVVVNPLRVHKDVANELEHNLLLCYVGQSNEEHSGIIADQTRRYLRASDSDRTAESLRQQKKLATQMKDALITGRLTIFGELMNEAWAYKKQMSPMITTPMIDAIYDAAIYAGALGGKLTGAGGGGYMIFYCPFEKKHKVAEAVRARGAEPEGFSFSGEGLQTWRLAHERNKEKAAVGS